MSSNDMSRIREELRERIFESIDPGIDYSDEALESIIVEIIREKSKERFLSIDMQLELKYYFFNAIRRLDILQELIDDPDITEIMVNGEGGIFYEKEGWLYRWDKSFDSREKIEDIIQQIVSRSNRQVNETTPIVDTRLRDGSRVNIVLEPIAVNGPIITIRKFPKTHMTVEDLVEKEALSEESAQFLRKLIMAGYNILISGSTGAGKTTLLNALADFIPKDERIVTIEDSAELQIKGISNMVRLEARNPNAEHQNEISIRDLIKTALRLRPGRIIVGEVRGPEAVDMLNAMNTGHSGSFCTLHSNNVKDAVSRIETMVLMGMDIPLAAIRKQIASSVDIIIQLGRLRDKSRRILEIAEVEGYEEGEVRLNSLYKFVEDELPAMVHESSTYGMGRQRVQGGLVATGNELRHRAKLSEAAITL